MRFTSGFGSSRSRGFGEAMADPLEFDRMFVTTGPGGGSWVYDVERLWRLAEGLPVREVPLGEFDAVLDERHSWGEELTNRAVARHARKIYEADLSYPVMLSAGGEVMDGHHRIAKAWLLGMETIKAVRFEVDPLPDGVR